MTIRTIPVSINGYRRSPQGATGPGKPDWPAILNDYQRSYVIAPDRILYAEPALTSNKADLLTSMALVDPGIEIWQVVASYQTLDEQIAIDNGDVGAWLGYLTGSGGGIYYDLEQWANSRGEDSNISASATSFVASCNGESLGKMGGLSGQLQSPTSNVGDFVTPGITDYSARWLGYVEARGGVENYAKYMASHLIPLVLAANASAEIWPMISLSNGQDIEDAIWFFEYINANTTGGIDGMSVWSNNRVYGYEATKEFLRRVRGGQGRLFKARAPKYRLRNTNHVRRRAGTHDVGSGDVPIS